jgi:hypothetical protein
MSNRRWKLAALAAAFLFATKLSHASFLDEQQDAVWVHYKMASVAATTATVVVDLSDTANFPHKDSGFLKIVGWHVDIDQVAAGTSTVRLGVVTSINASSGTVTWFYQKSLTLNVSGTSKLDSFVLAPGEVNTKIKSGATPYILGSDQTDLTSTDALLFQNDIPIPSARGGVNTALPAVGDIVALVVGGGANAVIPTVDLLYLSEP